jgi:hypothetical protein
MGAWGYSREGGHKQARRGAWLIREYIIKNILGQIRREYAIIRMGKDINCGCIYHQTTNLREALRYAKEHP